LFTLTFFTAYKSTYGDEPVWKNYRRRITSHFQPDIRTTCIV